MKKYALLLTALVMSVSTSLRAQESFHGYSLTSEGAWCWFADPRAIHYCNDAGTINASYIGYIDVHGNVKAMQMDYITGRRSEVLVRSYFQPDDHNNPTFLVLPDERVLIIYSRHTDEPAFYYRVSKYPGDISILGEEKCIKTNHNTTYPSPFILSDDPEHFYLCWRGLGWHPTIARLTLPDKDDNVKIKWGPYQMVQSTGARPYAKYYSNGKDKLYLTYTTGHPDNEQPNWLYFNTVNINATTNADGTVSVTPTLEDIKGNRLSEIAAGKFNVNKTSTYKSNYPYTIVDAPSNYRDWVWQIACDDENRPVIAMVRINGGKDQHQYYYAKWTGSSWRLTDLANGGGRFHPSNTEYCYSGGMAIDPENPNVIYLSIPTAGVSGKSVHEIWKYTLNNNGTITEKEQITRNSEKNNVRPFVLPNSKNSPMRLLWMNGDYYYWLVRQGYPQGYPTAIHADYEWPVKGIDLTASIIEEKDYGQRTMSTADTEQITIENLSAFTLNISLQINAENYQGNLVSIAGVEYGLDKAAVKPYVKIGDKTYWSSNRLYTSDNWAQNSTGTSSDNWPTPLKAFNITLTYDGNLLTIYRNGLIDQSIEVTGLTANNINIGGYDGKLHHATVCNRSLTQDEVKMLIYRQALKQLSVPTIAYTDIVLPTKAGGEAVIWTSNHPETIAPDGTFTAPETETAITLTAAIQGTSRTFTIKAQPRDISNNLITAYHFEAEDLYSANGNRYITDRSGHEHHLLLMGNATADGTLDLTRNNSTTFTTNGYAIVPAQVMDSLRSYTILLEATPKSLNKAPRLYDFGYNSGNSLFLRANSLSAGIKYNNGSTTMINSSAALTIENSYKLAVTYNARTGITSIYIDGQLVANGTENINEPYMIAANAPCTRNYIGRTQWWDTNYGNDNGDYVGSIDNFKMYNTALTQKEIAIQQGIRIEDETLNVNCTSVIVNPDFEGTYSTLAASGVTSDRAIYVPQGWTNNYTERNENDMTILNSSCLYASLFNIPTNHQGGKNAYLVRQKWGTSTITLQQQCDTLPAGYYTLTADIWQSGLGGNASLWTQVGSNIKNSGTAPANSEEWQNGKVAFSCNGIDKVIFGVSAIHTSNGSEKYLGFDNICLYNTTANRTEADIYTLLTTMVTAADKVLTGELNSQVRNLLEKSKTQAENTTPETSHETLLAAYYALSDALALRHTPIIPDGINAITTSETAKNTYDLQGRQTNPSQTLPLGIYILNNKKVLKLQ